MRLFVFLLLFTLVCVGQTPISSKKLNDSALSIYKNQPQKALEIFQQSESLAKSKSETLEYARAKNGLGLLYRDLGAFEKAIAYANDAMSISKDSLLTASALNNIGRSKRQLGFYEDALTYYLRALDIYDELNKKEEEATVTNNIGLVYSYLGINDKAIEYHLKAKTAFEELNNKKGISEVYNNIAIIYANDGDLEKALNYFKYSLAIEVNLNDKKGMAESANNVGAVYYYMQEVDSALTYFEQSVTIEKSIGNFAGLPASFNNIAQVLIENKRLSESITYIDSAYQYAKDYKVATEIENSLLNYSEYYEASQNNSKALDYYKAYTQAKDSLLNLDTNSKIAELEIEYQTEKKEKELLEHRADLAEKELDLSKKNNYILGLSALAIVLMLLGYLIYNQQKLKNRQLKKENELNDALIKIETQNKLQNQRLRISRDLHDNIGAQLTFIISSLDNLKYGFQLPEKLSQKLGNISAFTTTTINELRDTIWAMNKNEITFEDLQVRISNFIDKANLAAHNIVFQLHIEDNVDKIAVFSSIEGMNIYRIIQEAINNALKYADAKTIRLTIEDIDCKLKIIISDDGKGFNQATVKLGNGIQNMKKRAAEINAGLIVDSKEHKGTRIILNL